MLKLSTANLPPVDASLFGLLEVIWIMPSRSRSVVNGELHFENKIRTTVRQKAELTFTIIATVTVNTRTHDLRVLFSGGDCEGE